MFIFVWFVKLVKESIVSKIKTCLFDYLLPKYCFVNNFRLIYIFKAK